MKKIKILTIIVIFILLGGFFTVKGIKEERKNANISNNKVESNLKQEENEKKEENVQEKSENKKEEVKVEIPKKEAVEKSYFDDALFIGDSRTVGISEYGDLHNATFFANTGMSVYNVFEKSVSVPKVGKLKLEQLLTSKKFKKVYIMLGINELGYNSEKTLANYKKLLEYVKKTQSNAIIYIQANLHVTKQKSESDKIINNKNINKFNNEISKLADDKSIFYIDINQKFDDNNGNLTSDYTKDNVHIYAKYYKEWSNWLSQNAIVKGG